MMGFVARAALGYGGDVRFGHMAHRARLSGVPPVLEGKDEPGVRLLHAEPHKDRSLESRRRRPAVTGRARKRLCRTMVTRVALRRRRARTFSRRRRVALGAADRLMGCVAGYRCVARGALDCFVRTVGEPARIDVAHRSDRDRRRSLRRRIPRFIDRRRPRFPRFLGRRLGRARRQGRETGHDDTHADAGSRAHGHRSMKGRRDGHRIHPATRPLAQ